VTLTIILQAFDLLYVHHHPPVAPSPCRPVAPSLTLKYSCSYSAALRSQDQSWLMPVWISLRQSSDWERYRATARRTVSRNAPGVKGTNRKPVAVPAASVAGVQSVTVSASPPTARTTGGVPYFRAYSCVSPAGSYRLGMRYRSAPASIWWASPSSKP